MFIKIFYNLCLIVGGIFVIIACFLLLIEMCFLIANQHGVTNERIGRDTYIAPRKFKNIKKQNNWTRNSGKVSRDAVSTNRRSFSDDHVSE